MIDILLFSALLHVLKTIVACVILQLLIAEMKKMMNSKNESHVMTTWSIYVTILGKVCTGTQKHNRNY